MSFRKTPLYEAHLAEGGRMVEFAGYEMPVQYGGVRDEHLAVRQAAGLFDVSHMGEVFFEGPDAVPALNRLLSNDLRSCEDGQAQYNTICKPDGGIVDDTVVYRISDQRLFLVTNAANHEKDFRWLLEHVEGDVEVTDRAEDFAQLALQGPRAAEILAATSGLALDHVQTYRFDQLSILGHDVIVARTGYTGEDGFELYCAPASASPLWSALLTTGRSMGLLACGLGARDSLRLECKYCLYGNDIDETTSPLEAGLGWVVKLDKGDFIGRDALAAQKQAGGGRRLVGFEMEGRGIARHGYPVFFEGEEVGVVTSGTMSPSLGKAIGMAYVPFERRRRDTTIEIGVRGRKVAARVVKTPFYRRQDV